VRCPPLRPGPLSRVGIRAQIGVGRTCLIKGRPGARGWCVPVWACASVHERNVPGTVEPTGRTGSRPATPRATRGLDTTRAPPAGEAHPGRLRAPACCGTGSVGQHGGNRGRPPRQEYPGITEPCDLCRYRDIQMQLRQLGQESLLRLLRYEGHLRREGLKGRTWRIKREPDADRPPR
jgi:hypothetical protein